MGPAGGGLGRLGGTGGVTRMAQAQVTLRYEPTSPEVQPIEQEFILDKSNTQRALREVIFEPVDKAYQYKVKYTMANGKEYATEWKSSRQPRLYVDDPFGATKTITLVAVGDLDKDIATIYVDMRYVDEKAVREVATATSLQEQSRGATDRRSRTRRRCRYCQEPIRRELTPTEDGGRYKVVKRWVHVDDASQFRAEPEQHLAAAMPRGPKTVVKASGRVTKKWPKKSKKKGLIYTGFETNRGRH